MSPSSSAGRRRAWLTVVAAAGIATLGAAVIWALAGGTGDPLARSSPAEVALRTARLAGITHAAAGSVGDVAIVRLDLPAPASAPDVAVAWLTGLGLLSGAYPGSERYVVQVFAEGGPLVEHETPARALREAIASGDFELLRARSEAAFIARSATPRTPAIGGSPVPGSDLVPQEDASRAGALLSAAPVGAAALPGDAAVIDLHVPGGYLDAKNRAAGLLGDAGLTVDAGPRLIEAVSAVRAAAPAVAALELGADMQRAMMTRLDAAIDGLAADGIDDLRVEAERLMARGDRDSIARAQSLVASAEAQRMLGLDLALPAYVAEVARLVGASPLTGGASSDAVRAAAGDDGAPEDSVDVRAFSRDPSLDVSASDAVAGDLLPARVLRLHGVGDPPVLEWPDDEERDTTAAELWLGYRRADGSVYWLAGEDGTVALTDASIRGWAYTTERAALVDASRSGRVLAHLAAE